MTKVPSTQIPSTRASSTCASSGQVHVRKYHALGNDYLVVEGPLEAWPSSRVARVCDRHGGVGSDGILVAVASDVADVGVRVVNPDGSEAETSGNGLRIFARWAVDLGVVQAGTFTIEARAGVRMATVSPRPSSAGAPSLVTVSMGRVSLGAVGVPLGELVDAPADMGAWPGDWTGTEVRVGNPHVVVVGPEPSEELARRLGPALEHASRWPRRTNVQIATTTSPTAARAVVWERGAGWTLASGSSACAVAAALRALGRTGDRVAVAMPGGTLTVEIGGDDEVTLSGEVAPVFAGGWWEE